MKDLMNWIKDRGGSINLSIALFIILLALVLDRPIPCARLMGVAVGVTEWTVAEGPPRYPPQTMPLILEFEGKKRIVVSPDGSVHVEDSPEGIVYIERILHFDEPQRWLEENDR